MSDKLFTALNDSNDKVDKKDRVLTTSEYKKRVFEEFKPVYVNIEELTVDERKIYEKTEQIMSLVNANRNSVKSLNIVESLYQGDKRQNVVGLWRLLDQEILIQRSQLSSIDKYAGTLLHEYIHAYSSKGDVSRDFEIELSNVIGVLVGQIMK